MALKVKSDRISDIKKTIFAVNDIRWLTKYIELVATAIFVNILFSSVLKLKSLSIVEPR